MAPQQQHPLQPPQMEKLNLSDGTTMDLARPGVDDNTWWQVKKYLENNPAIAKGLQNVSKDADAIRSWLQTQVMDQHYINQATKEGKVKQRLQGLEKDPELRPVLAKLKETMKKDGLEAALAACGDKELMKKISYKMGGTPPEIHHAMKKLDEASLTLHEACKKGDMAAVKTHMAHDSVDAQDHNGITPLGYAIGANKPKIIQLLLKNNANQDCVDKGGNSGLHYAAGYGRIELMELLLKAKANVSRYNGQGQTPLAVATLNRQQHACEILAQHGARS
jgi:hypothetical protein